MKKLSETRYNAPNKLFAFDSQHNFVPAALQFLAYSRWAPYEICMDDELEWWTFFQTKTAEICDAARLIFESAASIDTPFRTYEDESSQSSGTSTTDTTKVVNEADNVQASSGYDNNQTGATDKNLDTPQASIENLDDGYLTSASKSTGTNNNANLQTTSGSQSSTTEHSGGVSSETDSEGSRKGYTGDRADLLLNYLQKMPHITKQLTDLWSECFVLFFEEV